ncbi:hypothetical protein ABFA25_08625 [Mycobacterium lepromatosis]|uniref:hypothetical protein n=1 Tax=Mycobacterium lepromatosis TaxID=480418 RepID=UPI0006978C9E
MTISLIFAAFPTKELDVVNLNFPPQAFAPALVRLAKSVTYRRPKQPVTGERHHRPAGYRIVVSVRLYLCDLAGRVAVSVAGTIISAIGV